MAGLIRLQWRPFGFVLPQPLATAAGTVHQRRGWLLRAQGSEGALGWGEAAPLDGQLKPLAAAIEALGSARPREALEADLAAGGLPPALAFALGAALAELDGLPRRRRQALEQLLQQRTLEGIGNHGHLPLERGRRTGAREGVQRRRPDA